MGLFDSIFGGSESTTVTNPDQIAPFQLPILQGIQGGAFDLAQQQAGQIGPFAQGLSQQLGQSGQNFLGSLAGVGAGIPGIGMQAAQAQQRALQQGLGQNLEFGLNQIQNRFGQAGSTGSRAGLAGETLLGQNQLALAQGTADIFRNQGGLSLGAGGLQNQAAGIGLSSLGGLLGLGLGGFGAAFQPFEQAAGIAPPIVLGQGGSQTQSSSRGIGGLLSGVGGLAGGLGSFGGFLNDRRVLNNPGQFGIGG